MRIGSIVYNTEQGLGYLAKSFYDHGIVTDILVVQHSHYVGNPSWYPKAEILPELRTRDSQRRAEKFVETVDLMLYFETPFHWGLLPHARKAGVPSVLMPMHECMPEVLPYQPDYFLCPSMLDKQCYPDRSKFLPVPVEIPWRKRERALRFMHNAGRLGLKGRNGTAELIDAIKHIQSPIELVIRSQKPLPWGVPNDPRVKVEVGSTPYSELFSEGDVFVFPEKFNGLSLPLQEAYASGMLVMASDRYPNTTYLPHAPLIPVMEQIEDRVAPRCRKYMSAVIRPEYIAAKIDEFYDKDISEFSVLGAAWARMNSWELVGPRYKRIFEMIKKGEQP